MPHKDLIGQTFGMLTVIEYLGQHPKRGGIWKCICSCDGNECTSTTADLNRGKKKSCGCLKAQYLASKVPTRVFHGLSKTPEYYAWHSMLSRCYRPTDDSYADYGGRNITVCQRWLKPKGEGFLNFLEDMGTKPTPKHSLDRFPDVNGNYFKENCRWATEEQQANNKRNTVYIEYEGERYPLAMLAKKLEIDYNTFKHHLALGHSIEYMIQCKSKFTQRSKDAGFTKGKRLVEYNGETLSLVKWSYKFNIDARRLGEYLKTHTFEQAYHHYMNKLK